MIFNIFCQYNNSFVYLCKSHSFLLITNTKRHQMKGYSSSFKVIIPLITLVFTAHIPLNSLTRFWYFSTFSFSLALTLPSSGTQCNNYTFTVFLFLSMFTKHGLLASFPRSAHTLKSHKGLYLHFRANFLEHGHTTSHFVKTHIFLTDHNERPQPRCQVCFCIIFVYVSFAHELTIWLIGSACSVLSLLVAFIALFHFTF